MAGVFNSLFLSLLFNRSLSSSQTGNRNTIRRAGNIVQTDGIEELKDVLSSSADSAKLDSEADVEAAVSEPNNNVRP